MWFVFIQLWNYSYRWFVSSGFRSGICALIAYLAISIFRFGCLLSITGFVVHLILVMNPLALVVFTFVDGSCFRVFSDLDSMCLDLLILLFRF